MPAPSSAKPSDNRIEANLIPSVIEKIKLVQHQLDLNSTEFAVRTHISQATMSRINADQGAWLTMRTLAKIVNSIEGLTISWFLDPANVSIPEALAVPAPTQPENWEGGRLKRFRRHNDLSKVEVADAAGVAASNYAYYEKSQQVKPQTRERLIQAFGRLLKRTVSEFEVFGLSTEMRPLTSTETGSYPVPRIWTRQRGELTSALIESLRYAPASQQATENVYYVDSRLFRSSTNGAMAGQPTDYFALEISQHDRIEPMLHWVLARLVSPSEYARIVDGLVGVVTRHGDFYVRRVQRNALGSSQAELVLASQDGSGAQITIVADDITLFFHIPRILDGSL